MNRLFVFPTFILLGAINVNFEIAEALHQGPNSEAEESYTKGGGISEAEEAPKPDKKEIEEMRKVDPAGSY